MKLDDLEADNPEGGNTDVDADNPETENFEGVTPRRSPISRGRSHQIPDNYEAFERLGREGALLKTLAKLCEVHMTVGFVSNTEGRYYAHFGERLMFK